MNILFITCGPLGDTVLTTGLLSNLVEKYPQSRVTIACGPLGTSLFDGLPQKEEVIPLVKRKRHGHWIDLWKRVISRKWDIVVDLRNSAVSRLIFANKKYIKSRGKLDSSKHWVEQNAGVLGLHKNPPDPKIWFSAAQLQQAKEIIGDQGLIIGVGPTAGWLPKIWPAAHFIAVLKNLTKAEGYFPNARICVFGAPGEEDLARPVLEAFSGDRVINMVGKADPGTVAAVLSLCDFYIGNDSGLMHTSAAVGTMTFGLFGPSPWQNYYPWGKHCGFARTPESFEELTDFPGYHPKTCTQCLMTSLTVETVKKGIENLFAGKNSEKTAAA